MSAAGPHPDRRHVSRQEEGQTKAVHLLTVGQGKSGEWRKLRQSCNVSNLLDFAMQVFKYSSKHLLSCSKRATGVKCSEGSQTNVLLLQRSASTDWKC